MMFATNVVEFCTTSRLVALDYSGMIHFVFLQAYLHVDLDNLTVVSWYVV